MSELTDAERETLLVPLLDAGWHQSDNGSAIAKSFVFKDFTEAFSWMTAIAIVAEKMGHHPEWRNVYKTVDVTLTTHDAGGLTQKDIDLAQKMDSYGPHA